MTDVETVPVPPEGQVVVTYDQVKKVLTGPEAVGNILEAAQDDADATPAERAAAMAAVGNVLKVLQRAEQMAGAKVLTTAQNGPASRLQSLIASGELGSLSLTPLATGGLEAQFDTKDWSGWAQVAWAKLKAKLNGKHPLLRPHSTVPLTIPDNARIGVLGDWGTGLYGAPVMARTIAADRDQYTMLVHLGDVYYSGTSKEVTDRFLKLWPRRAEAINRALNSNHEMYSGGTPYFTQTLSQFQQDSSYFAVQNARWTLVGLDVAYRDHAVDDIQVDWFRQVLAQAGERRVVVFSHHQLYSHFEGQGTKLWTHPDFGDILRSKRISAWYWGHEHRCSVFEGVDSNFGIRARCIGSSGMPQSRTSTIGLPRVSGTTLPSGDWRRSGACTREGNDLPSCLVLEGENRYIKGEEEKFTPHCYAVITLDGKFLREQVLSPTGETLYDGVLGE